MTGPEQHTERVHVEITIGAPVDVVWRALRDPAEIQRWHGWHVDGLDEEIEIIYRKDFTESAAEHWLQLGSGDRFELTDLGGQTRLRMIRGPRGANPEWDAYYEDINEGWTTFMHQLKFALERHPGVDRRTVFRSGVHQDRQSVLAATGLDMVADVPIGQRYAVTTTAGEALAGEVWFRSTHQIGLSVEGWGDGLLVVGDQPVSDVHPDGGAMAILTTYGLAPDAFKAIESRWGTWWASAFGDDPGPAGAATGS